MPTSLHCIHLHKPSSIPAGHQALNAKYAYSMGVRYPSAFAGSDKKDITSTSTIKMLKSIVTWRGNGLGDGYKEKLTESMTQAIRSHK